MRFSSLARIATAQLTDNVFKATIFEAGLRPNIRCAIAVFPLVSYTNIVTRSLAIEAKEAVLKKDRDASTPSKSVQMSSSQQHRNRQKHQAYSTPHTFQRPLCILQGLHFMVHISQKVIGEVLYLIPKLVIIVAILAIL